MASACSSTWNGSLRLSWGKLREVWQRPIGKFRVVLQRPTRSLAQTHSGPAFSLRPDISILDRDRVFRIFDAKWKRLDPSQTNAGVFASDIYQLTAYLSRY